jgi:hypothetical protein
MDLTAIAVSLTAKVLSLIGDAVPSAPAGSADILTLVPRATT